MKKSYISILLLFLVMILAVSAVSAAEEIDDSSDSVLQAVDEVPIEEAASDIDVAQATDDADVIADAGDGNNFTSLQTLIDNSQVDFAMVEKDYTRAEGEQVIEINRNFALMTSGGNHKIDANNLGGIFKIKEGVTFVIQGLTLVNGNSTDNGGAIYNEGRLSIKNCILTDNKAANYGGAIYNKAILEIDESTFIGNDLSAHHTSGEYGGYAIWSTKDATSVNIRDSTFTDNGAGYQNGDKVYGAVAVFTGATIENSVFTNNNGRWGGAIGSYGYTEGTLIVKGSKFNSNKAHQGGAIFSQKRVLTVEDSQFNANEATDGGAIDNDAERAAGYDALIINSVFDSNKASHYGSAIMSLSGFTYADCNFTNNIAGTGTATIHYCTNSRSGSDGMGDGNFADSSIIDCRFEGNSASYYGAVYFYGTKSLTVSGTDFINNDAGATTNSAAGALTFYGNSLEVTDSTFKGNTGKLNGSAISVWGGDASVSNSTFDGNTVNGNPNSIHLLYGKLALSNNTIVGDAPEIFVKNGEITSQINVVILNNDTCSTTTGKYMVTAEITDDNNNIIANADGFKFVTEGANVEAIYNATTKLYEGLLILPAPGVFTVNASYTDENLVVKTATIQNYKGTYSDLQKQINEAGSTLDLEYDFAYSPDLDGASYVDGVTISKTLLINGNGYTISGSNAARIFQVRSAPLTLSNAVLTKGNASEYGGAILVSDGTLILSSVNLTNNTAGVHGGAIYYVNALYEDSVITNCIFENNEAVDGSAGAIFFEDTDYNFELTIAGSNFTDNKAGAAAGAIYISIGYVGIDKSNFINNIADEDEGGAVYVGANAMVKIQNSVFNGNEAVKGNAIYKLGELSLSKNTINTENADIYNGGNTIYTDAKVTTFNATVAYGEKVNLTAIVTDDNDNLIYDSAVYFKIDGKEYDAKYNESTKRYELKDQEFKLATGNYPITMVAENIEDMNMVETGILTATPKKGTFSDLQYQINASNGELNLSYNFTYDAGYDADRFPEGVVIGDDLTINGNGYTISANGASRNLYFDGYVGVVLNDVTLANGAAKHGGAIAAYGVDFIVNNVNFVNNTATVYGGAICFWPDHTGDLVVRDCYFENNSADLGGAVFFNMKEHHMTIRDSAFVNNNATRYGGAIYVNNGDLVVNGTDFINNSAIQCYGGAICYWTDDTDLIINGGIFENNSANDASNGYGGAIFFNVADHSLKIDGADFVNNEARNGGAIYILYGNLDTTDTYFIENSATNYGGAIQIWPGLNNSPKYNLTITRGLFENNTANTFGGAIYFYNYQLIIDGTTFANNIATNDGGAIYQAYHNESTIITDADFINNRADNAGAIFTYGNGITIEGSTFNNNSAVNDYGAIYYKGGKNWLNIDDTKFINNSANNYGALYAIAATGTYARVNVVHSEFTENKAIAGNAGAVFIHDLVEEAYFTDVDFTANTATGIGGAVYVENIPYFTVNDCDFNDNEAVKGSAIFTQANNNASQWTKIINSRFSGNSAVGTIYNEGQIALNGNTINTTYAEIVNYGIITSAINAVVLGNKTVETAEDTYNLTAVLCDDKDNLIFNPDFKFIVNGVEKDFDSFDYEKGYLLADYPITLDHATYLVNATTTGAADLVNKFGIIKNLKIGTFTDLQNMINNTAEGTILVLPYHFTYNAEIDGDALKAGVVINKALTVDGNGSTISGADAARIFQLNADNINIINTTFTNGYSNTSSHEFADWGGAIYSNGAYSKHVISYCKFYNNTAYNGGAICLAGEGSVVTGCEFEDNNANASGGAVFIKGYADTISDSTFKFNIANELGGAVACDSTQQGAEIADSVFIGNSAFANGGAVSMQGAAGKITDSNFTGNAALNAGAVYWDANGGSITGGEFIENEAVDNLGGAIAVFKDATITESTFTNNTADYGGAIYVNGSAHLDITKSVMKDNTAIMGSSIYSNGTIGSSIVNATILENKTWNDTGLGDIYIFNATLTDDMGNSIYAPNFRFAVDGVEIDDEPIYDNETGLYVVAYAIETAGYKVISTSYNADNLQKFTGALDVPLANLTKFEVQAWDTVSGENATIFVSVYGVDDIGLNTTVTLILNNTEYIVPVVDGEGNLTIALENGIYPVVAHYIDDKNYHSEYDSTVFKVVTDTQVIIDPIEDIDAYGDAYVVFDLIANDGFNITGPVTLIVVNGFDYVEYIVPIYEGTGFIDLEALAPGTYTVQATYQGNDDYMGNVSNQVTFKVKELTEIEVAVDEPVFIGYEAVVTVSNIPVASGNLTVTINGKEYDVIPVDNDTAVIVIESDDIIYGENELTVVYSGTDNYSSKVVETTFTAYNNIVTEDNFNVYFNEYGVLKDDVPFDELIFEGEFSDLGITHITVYDVAITGADAVLYDIGFVANGNVALSDMKLVASESLKELISVTNNNVNITGLDISYTATEGSIAIDVQDASNVTIKDSNIFFQSNVTNDATDAMAINVLDSSNVVIDNNEIYASLSAVSSWFSIYYKYGTMGIDKVHAIRIGGAEDVTLTNNNVDAVVNGGISKYVESEYGNYWDTLSLEAVLIIDSNIVLVEGNNFTVSDPITPEGTPINLYGMTLTLVNNIIISSNNFDISTDGGIDATGTAYPIQLATCNVDIIENNITTVSYGPNLGIYVSGVTASFYDYTTQESYPNPYYTENFTVIIRDNYIDVTGYAESLNTYSLVSGIEACAGEINVIGNTIFVENSAGYVEGAHVYGISQAQQLSPYAPSFTIEINYVDVETGDYAVSINFEANATVDNNTLYAIERMGDDAAYAVSEDAVIKDNLPEKLDINITVNVDNIKVGENATIMIFTNEEFNGQVNVNLNGKDLSVDVEDGFGLLIVPDLAAANYTVNVTFAGDFYFNAGENATEFEVSKNAAPELTITIGNVTVDTPVEVTISLPGVTGEVTIFVDGANDTVTLTDGTGTYTIVADKVTAGPHNIVAVFEGDDVYVGTQNDTSFNVSKAEDYEFDVNISVEEIDVGDNLTVDVTLPEDANGNITVLVNGEPVDVVPVKDGNATVTIPASAFTAGENTVSISYGDDKYGETTQEKTVYVNKLASDLYATAANIEIGQNATVEITLPTITDGTVTVTMLGETYIVNITDGKGTATIAGLGEGTYTANVYFTGDSAYEDNDTSVTFNVTKDVIPAEDAFNFTTPENSTSQVISVNLSEDATGFLLLDINGTQTHVPLVNGKANVTVPNLVEGTYNATITYTGDEKYAPITTTKEINVTSNVPDSALSIPDSAKSDAPTTYSVNLPSDATGYLEVDVDGKKYVDPLNNGSASVTIPALSEGNHNVTVKYTGDNKYSPVTKATTLNVTAPVFKLSQNKNVAVVYSANANYKVLVTRDGKAVGAGETVTFKFNGKTYTAKTDAKGYATLKLSAKVKVKKYTITATYKGVTVKNTVKVTHLIKAKNSKVKKSKKVNKIKVETKKVNGKYLKGKKLTLKIKGKKVKAKINKKGVATFKLKKSITKKLKAGKKYKYSVTYGKDKVTKKITVKK